MDPNIEKIVQQMQERFGVSFEEFRGEAQVLVQPDKIISALAFLRDEQSFELLSAQTAVDYWPQVSPRFHVVYQMTSISRKLWLQLRVPVEGEDPSLPTASGLYDTANWRERELMDMFGIRFEGHPDPRVLLLPEDMEGHPLRRDFPLGYEEPQFTFNVKEIDLRKPYAKE